MKSLFKLLLVGVLMIGLTSGVNAETWEEGLGVKITFKDENRIWVEGVGVKIIPEDDIILTFSLPDGYEKIFDYTQSGSTELDYLREGSAIVVKIKIEESYSGFVNGSFAAKYPYDNMNPLAKEYFLKKNDTLITLNNNHKAILKPYKFETSLNQLTGKVFRIYDGITIEARSERYKITLSGFSNRELTEEDKSVINRILMSLDF